MNEWVSEWVNDWINEWMSKWVSEWTNGWMNEWMNERMHEWMNDVRLHKWDTGYQQMNWQITNKSWNLLNKEYIVNLFVMSVCQSLC